MPMGWPLSLPRFTTREQFQRSFPQQHAVTNCQDHVQIRVPEQAIASGYMKFQLTEQHYSEAPHC